VAVTADPDHRVADRRRMELIGPGLPEAPAHHVGGPWAMHQPAEPAEPIGDDALAALVAEVRAAAERATAAALSELAEAVGDPIVSLSLRDWPWPPPSWRPRHHRALPDRQLARLDA